VSAAIALELLATAGLIMLAARVYERAILRTGAPVRLRGLLGDGWHRRERNPVDATRGDSPIPRR
jgi:hypothetical protein